MITRRYYVITPTSELILSLEQSGIAASAARSELIVKKNSDRQRSNRDDDLALIRATYRSVFLNEAHVEWRDAFDTLARRIESESFDTFWSIEEFDDCEDVDDLIADLKLNEASESVKAI